MELIEKINSLIWGDFTIMLILLCGLFHSIRSRIHIRLPRLIAGSRGKNRLKAVTGALAASMGTGNITGCAAAIAVGGAGAVFWMWVSALLGMGLAYSENKIGADFSLKYKSKTAPMLYIEKGLGSKKLACIYAAVCIFAAYSMGCISQSWAFSDALSSLSGLPRKVSAVIIAVLTGVVILFSKRTADAVMNVTEKLVPVMSLFYGAGCIAFLILSSADIGGIIQEIITCAFAPQAAMGGLFGAAVSTGLRRGVFSNEAGMGSSVLIHSEADFGSAENAGAWAALEVFLDTIVCCTLTAFVILSSQCRSYGIYSVSDSFSEQFGAAGKVFACASVCLFAFGSVLGWCCYGEKCLQYLTDKGKIPYRIFFCLAAALGGIMSSQLMWGLADIFNAVLMFPNLLAITVISITEKTPSYRRHNSAACYGDKCARSK